MEYNKWRDIKSEYKMRRIKWVDDPIDRVWEWEKDMLENNPALKVYEEDPFVAVIQFRDNFWGLHAENADGLGDVWMYLIEGPEKGLLIDTAYGVGDTRALVEKLLNGKPYFVANTHVGIDHTLGNCRFDKVYCFPGEARKMRLHNEHIWDYLFDENGNPKWLEFTREDLPVWKPYEIVEVEDGHVFDLGDGYEVEMIWTAGHAEGHAEFIDKHNRILFCGDNMTMQYGANGLVDRPNPKPIYGGEHCNYKSFKNGLEKIMQRYDTFDTVYPQHFKGGYPKEIIPNCLKAVEEILANPEDYDETYGFVNKDNVYESYRLKHIDGFEGSFAFNI